MTTITNAEAITQVVTNNVTWVSNSPTVTIDNNGLATAMAPGAAEITAQLDSIVSNMTFVEVMGPVLERTAVVTYDLVNFKLQVELVNPSPYCDYF